MKRAAPDRALGGDAPRPTPPGAPPVEAPPEDDATVRARWEKRLASEDEVLVSQAVEAGCDAARADAMRKALAERRAARSRTLQLLREGKISRAEMATRARDTKRRTDAAIRAALTDHEYAALDPDGARAQVVEGE